jgi:hypothetical protein
MARIRWRLLMGLVSLGATLVVTLPPNAAQLEAAAANTWTASSKAAIALISSSSQLVEIWPNAVLDGSALPDQGSDLQGADLNTQ